MVQIGDHIMGKVVFSQIDSTTAVPYLRKEGGTHCRQLSGLARKILFRCHRDGVTVFPEYLWGVANLKEDALSRGKEAQIWSLGSPSPQSLFKRQGNSNSGGSEIFLSIPKHYVTSPGNASKGGR